MHRFSLTAIGHHNSDVVPSQPAESPLTMHELLPATMESVAVARRAVRVFGADLEVDLDGMVLAVSEAVANVVAHAYVEGAHGIVELSGSTAPFEVTLTVRDQGRGLTDEDPSAGAGYGLLIIEQLAQHVVLSDTTEGVVLTMRFQRGAG